MTLPRLCGVDHGRVVLEVLEAAGLPTGVRPQRARDGVGNHVYFAGDFVVRLGTGSDGVKFPRAAAVLRAAKGRVAVPDVVYEDCSGSTFEVPVMVLARVRGQTLSRVWTGLDDAARDRVLEAVAVQLDALHGLRPHDVPAAGFPSPWWSHRVERIERWLVELRPHPSFPTRWFDHMERYFEDHRAALVDAPPACVLHNDVHWGNVLVDAGRVTALLDFDDTLAGPPEEDAWALAFECEECQPTVALERLPALPGFDLTATGALERLRICEIENILELLTGDLTWVDPPTALADARETYAYAFDESHYSRMLARLTPG